jgi:hypothetical protein
VGAAPLCFSRVRVLPFPNPTRHPLSHCHSERNGPIFLPHSLPANGSACAERNLLLSFAGFVAASLARHLVPAHKSPSTTLCHYRNRTGAIRGQPTLQNHHDPRPTFRAALHPRPPHHVWGILKWLGTGATHAQIIADYPELTEEDILAALQWAVTLKDTAVLRELDEVTPRQ